MADTHYHKHNEPIIEPFCFSSYKSDIKMNKDPPSHKFEDAVNTFVERRSDLAHRQQYLKDKVSTLQRTIPALMAFNMWMSGEKCEDAPLCKIREIMNKFSPYPDPTEKLLKDLKNTVEDLHRESAELHEKIITADVALEESGMELESLELSNKEMGYELKALEKEIDKKSTLSLHSIHSEDLVCLTRIRQLGEEEKSLKCCIRQLEEKEMFYRKQMECLLTSKEFQNTLGGNHMTKRLKELETSDKKWRCTYQTQKYNMHQMKKKIIEKEQELARLGHQSRMSQNPDWSADQNQNRKTRGDDEPVKVNKKDWTSWNKNQTNPFSGRLSCPPRSCCVPLMPKHQSREKKSCSYSSSSHPGPKQKLESERTKFCGDNPLCQPPPCNKSSASCPPIKSPFGNIPSSNNGGCLKCPPPKTSGCRCSCKGKCARGKSEVPCNCGSESESNYYLETKHRNVLNIGEASIDDEFRECDCGCNDEDDPGTCLFK